MSHRLFIPLMILMLIQQTFYLLQNNSKDVCDVNVKYNADNDRVSVTTSAVKFGQHALCSASITQQGSKNSITVNFTEQ